ncbi:MAG: hypothetical protein KBC02_00785 [Candidatus Pacebacteria bacterium]|nr:hypothetical protein [Candidatus Paceibacterota bacterium]
MERTPPVYSKEKATAEASSITKTLTSKHPEQNGAFTRHQYESESNEIARRQIELIKIISSLQFPSFLFGGYAAEILLKEKDGKCEVETFDTHTDIDMAVSRKNQASLERALQELGISYKATSKDHPRKLYITNANGLQADFAIFDVDEETGKPYIFVEDKNVQKKAYVSTDFFAGETITVQGIPVRIASPKSLIQSLQFYTSLGHTLRDKDLQRAQQLRDKYYPGIPLDAEEFKIKITE